MIPSRRYFTPILCLVLLFCWQSAGAITDPYPLRPPDTSSPRATMKTFMDSMNRVYQRHLVKDYSEAIRVHFRRAAGCLDLSKIAPSVLQDVGLETALLLKEIFDRIELPPFEKIPDQSAVHSEGLTQWTVPNTEITISKVEEGPHQGKFLFSTDAVARVREFYDRVAHLPYKPGASVDIYEDYIFGPGVLIPQGLIRNLPDWIKIGFYDQAVWQWFGLLLTLLITGLIIVLVFRWSQQRPVQAESDEEAAAPKWSWRKLVFPLILVVVILTAEYFVDEQINITGNVLKLIKMILRTFVFIASGWAIVVIGNGIAEAIISSKRMFAKTIDANLVRLISRLITVVLLCVLLWNTSDYLGMSLTAVFASAGIVGLGVALAARETLANFFGGISIFLDRPFKSGDYIVLDTGERGRVVEVGLRSTRIVTRDDIQISIPNS
ncbi:MAG: mechanosensitive ion channel family protein, partial [Desulfobacterales bacterium]